ncbi:hypothetical protein BDR26DRAFT_969861 [Obelidium mucronatum]|nr:hypothetical protein BDR26DRAFT_969861 [Obelidium mucronatum]
MAPTKRSASKTAQQSTAKKAALSAAAAPHFDSDIINNIVNERTPQRYLTGHQTVALIGAGFNGGQPKGGVDQGPTVLFNEGKLVSQIEALDWTVETEDHFPVFKHLKPNGEDSFGILKNVKYTSDVTHRIHNSVKKACEDGKLALTIGGDHSIAIGTVSGSRAVHKNLGVIWVDAHGDINTPESTSSGNLHGCPVAFVSGLAGTVPPFDTWLKPEFDLSRIVYIGLRDLDGPEKKIIRENKIKAFSMHEVDKWGIGQVVDAAIQYLYNTTPDYVAMSVFSSLFVISVLFLDVDGLDPSVAPATGTPVRGWIEFQRRTLYHEFLLKSGNRKQLHQSGSLVAVDITEVNPELGTVMERETTISNSYTAFAVTLAVPPLPPAGVGTWFYWPGLQTDARAANYQPVGFGVLQPPYASWYVAAWYVNLDAAPLPGFRGCYSGEAMLADPGDSLRMALALAGSVWTQTIVRLGRPCVGGGTQTAEGCQTVYALDMRGQGQNRAELVLELWNKAFIHSDVVFSSISLTIQNPEPAGSLYFCTSRSYIKPTETCTGISLSADKKTCTIDQCIFTKPAAPTAGAEDPPAPPVSNPAGGGSGSIAPPPPPADAPPETGGTVPIIDSPILSNNDTSSSSPSSTSSSGNNTSTGSTLNVGGVAIVWGDNIAAVVAPPASTTSAPASTSSGYIIKVALIIGVGIFVVVSRRRDRVSKSHDVDMELPARGFKNRYNDNDDENDDEEGGGGGEIEIIKGKQNLLGNMNRAVMVLSIGMVIVVGAGRRPSDGRINGARDASPPSRAGERKRNNNNDFSPPRNGGGRDFSPVQGGGRRPSDPAMRSDRRPSDAVPQRNGDRRDASPLRGDRKYNDRGGADRRPSDTGRHVDRDLSPRNKDRQQQNGDTRRYNDDRNESPPRGGMGSRRPSDGGGRSKSKDHHQGRERDLSPRNGGGRNHERDLSPRNGGRSNERDLSPRSGNDRDHQHQRSASGRRGSPSPARRARSPLEEKEGGGSSSNRMRSPPSKETNSNNSSGGNNSNTRLPPMSRDDNNRARSPPTRDDRNDRDGRERSHNNDASSSSRNRNASQTRR